eukprot:1145495-Pelagomonas_calceolata.AAC.1
MSWQSVVMTGRLLFPADIHPKQSSENEVRFLLHCPVELCQQGPVEQLLNRGLVALAPSHGDAGVHVIDLGRAQGHCTQVLLHMHLWEARGTVQDMLVTKFQAGQKASTDSRKSKEIMCMPCLALSSNALLALPWSPPWQPASSARSVRWESRLQPPLVLNILDK